MTPCLDNSVSQRRLNLNFREACFGQDRDATRSGPIIGVPL